jgi:hypothetical protein
MGRVLTNNTSFAFAREATETAGSRGIGFLPGEDPGDGGGALAGTPSWKTLEPNEISRFGASITTVARSPIRPQRGRQKGTISDLDSAVEIGADITVDSFLDLAEGFAFSTFSNLDLVFQAADAETTGDSYAVPSLSVAQAAKLQSDANGDTLLFASGYLLAANNGLKTLDTAAGSTDIALSVEENLADETAPDNARLEIAGMRLADGEMDLTITAAVDGVSGRIGSLNFDNIVPTTLGLAVGQVVYVRMTSVIRGYARVTAIGAASITIDRMDAALVASAPTGATTSLFFGQFLRDVASADASFLERSLQFEGTYPGLADDGTSDEYVYARGNFCNQLTFDLNLSDKGTLTAAFVGTDTDTPTETRKANAASALAPLGTEAFSTVSDFARLVIQDIDEDALTTDLKSIQLTINNNVSPEKVLNRLGARFINFGNVFVDLTTEILFTSGDVIDRIRENTTVGLDLFLQNNDGAICLSVPAMTMGDGAVSLPVNETVLLGLSGEAFEDPVTGASFGMSYLPSVPTS